MVNLPQRSYAIDFGKPVFYVKSRKPQFSVDEAAPQISWTPYTGPSITAFKPSQRCSSWNALVDFALWTSEHTKKKGVSNFPQRHPD